MSEDLFAPSCPWCTTPLTPGGACPSCPPVAEQPQQDRPRRFLGTAEELANHLAGQYTLLELAAIRPFDLMQRYGRMSLGTFSDGVRLAKQKLRGFKGSMEELADILKQRLAAGDLSALAPSLVAQEFGVELRFAQQAVNMANPPKPQWEPKTEPQRDDEPDTWQPMDLGPYLRGEVERPTPTVGLTRSDGLRMLYPGKEHAIIGEMESGKSWFSLGCVKAELDAGNTVLYLHFEEADPSDTVERLQALGVKDHDIEKRFRFIAPQSQVTDGALKRLLAEAPTLVVFDGVNEAMSLHGWGIREEDGAARFRRHLVMPCIRSGAATLSCDHVVKDKDSRGRNAIGSIHKGNGLSGSLILLENREPFGRGQRGRSNVFVTKDRPGHLRRHGNPAKDMPGKTYLGTLSVDATGEELELGFWAPSEDEAAPTAETDRAEVLAAVIQLTEDDVEANVGNVAAKARMKKQTVTDILNALVVDKVIVEGKRGNARVFTIPAGGP